MSKMVLDEGLFQERKELTNPLTENRDSDGWDDEKLEELDSYEVLDAISGLDYEISNAIRGAYTGAHTYEELGEYIVKLAENLKLFGEDVMEIEEGEEEE